ncbi:MAG: 1-(5-phosphoribosyl)-5-[(5-phosphoribosylamino)methylideneamino]imidazole-4-carboxamide isomerase [Dehalococcoidia bacterium]|nr:1-(5-phosphoribosyl)-5-[(5-phosphoribosylamino)methylideneamino]imidazole-4-carboxamide isomerase [Dehalococcoidia bacterium]MSQ16486.1 1-(5-phosphoribosyl)-5-[(5-phosphoribosylamino)methylideneamino]imidazole-4-carboxamide isomerase [Dehalococcoidia bacterium]
MEIIPAIDLRTGRCVRLYQGDYQRETVFSEDPVAVALEWQRQGAPRLHLVDLDGAAQGVQVNLPVIRSILVQLTIPVQVGGGVRDAATADALLAAGADRVVLGTVAVENPMLVEQLCRRHGSQRVVVAIDARDGQVATRGWRETTSVSAVVLADEMVALGVCRLLYTDIARDGTLTGPNVAANAALVRQTGLAVQASGGVSSLEHIRQLKVAGVEGVVMGQALYTGAIALWEALAVAASG